MTSVQTCREADCGRTVCRAQRCRPCFIARSLGWTISADELRSVPLGRLTDAELRQLRRETQGASSVTDILTVLIRIAPQALTSSVTEDFIVALEEEAELKEAEELAAAEHYDPEFHTKPYSEVPETGHREAVRYVSDWLDEEYDPMEAMRDDLRGPDFYDL